VTFKACPALLTFPWIGILSYDWSPRMIRTEFFSHSLVVGKTSILEEMECVKSKKILLHD
jgi:hypothetical protein